MAKKGGKKNRVQNVRVLDDYAGTDSGRIERMLGALQNSQAQTRVLCSDCYTLSVSSGAVNGLIGTSQIVTTDDFVSMAGQYETFRVTAIRVDVYDINPNFYAVGVFGTFHDKYLSNAQPVFSQATTVDSIDGQLVTPGNGKVSFTWTAKGTQERGFTSTDTTKPIQDYGGLRYSILGQTNTGPKYQVFFKAIVDFRGKY